MNIIIARRVIMVPSHGGTSSTLRPVCPGSTNNGGFVLACLLAEGLLQPIPDAQHGLARIDPAGFEGDGQPDQAGHRD